MIIAAIIVEREATFVLIMTSAEKLSPCSGSLSSDSQSPCLPAPLSKRYCGLPGTGSHPKMSLLLRLGQENSAYHGGPGRGTRLDHDRSQKGLHCVGADVHAICNRLAG